MLCWTRWVWCARACCLNTDSALLSLWTCSASKPVCGSSWSLETSLSFSNVQLTWPLCGCCHAQLLHAVVPAQCVRVCPHAAGCTPADFKAVSDAHELGLDVDTSSKGKHGIKQALAGKGLSSIIGITGGCVGCALGQGMCGCGFECVGRLGLRWCVRRCVRCPGLISCARP